MKVTQDFFCAASASPTGRSDDFIGLVAVKSFPDFACFVLFCFSFLRAYAYELPPNLRGQSFYK
jgi:hypothetical protein